MCTDVTIVYPILTIILACDNSPLQAKAMISNEMPDGKRYHTLRKPNPKILRTVFNRPLSYLASII